MIDDAMIDSMIGQAFRAAFETDVAIEAPKPADRLDAEAVGSVVTRHALEIGCTDSNATAAVAWGIRVGHDTLSCIRAGKLRAEQLRIRELSSVYRAMPRA